VLTCPACGRAPDPAVAWRCDCGHPLEFAAQRLPTAADPPDPDSFDRDAGIWGFRDVLPDVAPRSLGEGWTPLLEPGDSTGDAGSPAPDASPAGGSPVPAGAGDLDVALKLESVSPTGSFKDRGAAVTVALAADLGVDRLLEDSSGNAGLAVASYAARAGLDARIYVPADAMSAKVAAIERTGAAVERVAGGRAAATEACVDAVAADEGWYASHAWHPAFIAGTATFALEVAAQRGWTVPDAVVTPVGHGTLLLGASRGFRALREAGWTDQVPRLLGVQAAGVAPLVDAAAGGPGDERPDPASDAGAGPNDLADGIQVAEPVRRDGIEAAVAATDGDMLAVGAAATRRAHDRLARAGLHVEPTSAVALAGLESYRDRGLLEPGDDVVVPLTGSGLKG
jgi:threonine synthase